MIQTRRDGLFDPNTKIERVRLGYFYLEYVREGKYVRLRNICYNGFSYPILFWQDKELTTITAKPILEHDRYLTGFEVRANAVKLKRRKKLKAVLEAILNAFAAYAHITPPKVYEVHEVADILLEKDK